MKIKYLVLFLTLILAISCSEDPFLENPYGDIPENLVVETPQGIRLENYIVSDDIKINLKSTTSISTRIKILDIQDRLISQEKISIFEGDNILKVYVKAMPKSSYTIKVEDQTGNVIGKEIFSLIK
tara:strand:- start:97 stop:474 length:378 start_codon:yes stop_codon:yes gene_type:complete